MCFNYPIDSICRNKRRRILPICSLIVIMLLMFGGGYYRNWICFGCLIWKLRNLLRVGNSLLPTPSLSVCGRLFPHHVCWGIWKERNNRMFRNEERSEEVFVDKICKLLVKNMKCCRWRKLAITPS